MWGNRLGWGISAAIAIVVVGSFALYVRQASVLSPPTAFGVDAAAGSAAIGAASGDVLRGAQQPCDAATHYSEAIALYARDPSAYDAVAGGTSKASDASKLPAVGRLMEGVHCGQMTLFTNDPARVVRYGDVPELEALRAVGKAAVRVGLMHQAAKRNAEAIRCYEAAFALGVKLYDDRLTYRELMAGSELMGEAGAALKRLTFTMGDTARSSAAQSFDAARLASFTAKVQPVAAKLISIDPRTVSQHAGDVFLLADGAKERVWRVEAILALGRMRFFVGEGRRIGDQRGAEHRLKEHLNDKDPVIRTAAKAALDLTREQMRSLG